MSNVLPISSTPTTALNGSSLRQAAANRPVAITLNPVDSIDISEEARVAEHDQHEGKVDRIRDELAEGTYLHPDKLDIALDRLLDSLDA